MKRSINIVALAFATGVILLSSLAVAQEAKTKKPKPKTKKTPAHFTPPEVQEGLPNVLLIGDSISIGYMIPTREALAGQANVWRPTVNCGPTTRGVESVDQWLGDRKWDVIHFNFGLHDLKYMGPNNENLADPKAETSHQQVPIDQYVANLKQIAERLKKTGATVIFCETTPVPEGCKGRVVGDSVKYNEAARKAMQEIGDVEIDPLYSFAKEHAEQKPANVHYSAAGSSKLAEQVASVIRAAIKK
jgi:acyl-CoA thioesterase-1